MKKAMVTGSFDPITVGHLDLISRAADLFDEVYVVVLANEEKKNGMFTPAERLELCAKALEGKNNAIALKYGGLTADIAHKLGVYVFVRGSRSASDFDYEYGLANIMKHFDGDFETVILPSDPNLSSVSSTLARDLINHGADLSGIIPDKCIPLIKKMTEEKTK